MLPGAAVGVVASSGASSADLADLQDQRNPGRDTKKDREDGTKRVPLLRFSLPRNPDVVAMFLRTRVLRPDSEIWLAGYNALRKWADKHGDAKVPLDAVVPIGTTESDGEVDAEGGETYPLGAWVSEQRRAFRDGTLKGWRAELLNELGMIWSVPDARFWKNLAAARVYYAEHGTLAAPKDAMVQDVAVGQVLANLRKPGGLGKNDERAEVRRQALVAIDPYWNPPWPIDWQRHHAALADLLRQGATLAEVLPGVTYRGQDVGTWLQTQLQGWHQLSDQQQDRLTELGITPPAAKEQKTTKPQLRAFDRGITALAQYIAREGTVTVPRGHVEELPDGSTIKLGVFLSNHKTRRDRLAAQQRAALAGLGYAWAAQAEG